MTEMKSRRRVNHVPRAALLAMIILTVVVSVYRLTLAPKRTELDTRAALWAVASAFNENYEHNDVGAVYDRWDVASQSIISRSDYVHRHEACPTTPGAATTREVLRGPGGYWKVVYAISGVTNTDYWHFVSGQWRFNLARSNPAAVHLYREPFAAYAKDIGCTP